MRLLIAYFSWSGHTERIAKMLAVKTRGRLFRIERNPPYSTDYETCSEVEGKADAEEKLRPALKLLSRTYAHLTRFSLLFRYGTTPIPASSVPSFLRILTGWESPFTSSRTHWMKTPAFFPIR